MIGAIQSNLFIFNEIQVAADSSRGLSFAYVATEGLPSFGRNLKRLRTRAGFRTSRALARALGVVPSVVSKMENNQQGLPEGPTLLKLAKTLRCTLDELFDGVDPDYEVIRRRVAAARESLALTESTALPVDVDVLDALRDPLIARAVSLLRRPAAAEMRQGWVGSFESIVRQIEALTQPRQPSVETPPASPRVVRSKKGGSGRQ